MEFHHRYSGSSDTRNDADATAMKFEPDTLRQPTYFRGRLAKQLEFREAISALHDVVTSDLRFIPKDRTKYFAWRDQQSYIDLAKVASDQKKLADEIAALSSELVTLEAAHGARHSNFYAQRKKYFDYLYQKDKDLWFKLDPVITVHPDQVFFECFSRDESSYGRLAANYEVFEELGERANGTTNIDYSDKLYGEFQKIRSYKTTTLDIDPTGFDVKTSLEQSYREVKIDLPDTWVRGFLQVSSAATLPASVVELHPMDVHNLCLVLRRHKELVGPRSLRFQLSPGGPVSITVDPWGTKVECPRSKQVEGQAGEIRIWGRRRLFILERLLPRAKRVRLFLLGSGLPSYWVVDLGDLSFTLGLSGWTNNNWSEAGNFDLMAAREDVDVATQDRVFNELGKTWFATPEELAQRTKLSVPTVASALVGWVQCGRAIYDLDRGVYRKRELTRDPLPVEKLRFSNAREQEAAALLHHAKVAIDRAETVDGALTLQGRVVVRGKLFGVLSTFDVERRLVRAECNCDYYIRNKLFKGPCAHMLVLRAAHRRGINDKIEIAEAPKPKAPEPVRESFEVAQRNGVKRAAELRAAGRIADSIAELEKLLRLAPPGSVEQAKLHEVLAEARIDAGDFVKAKDHAEQALAKIPASKLALRIKRDALARLDELPAAIAAARALAQAEDTPARWEELCGLCVRAHDDRALLAFAEEALQRHRRHVGITTLRDAAQRRLQAPPPEPPPPPAEEPAPKKVPWYRRMFGLGAKPPSLEMRLDGVIDALALADRDAAMQLLRTAHGSAERDEARVFAMVAALKDSTFASKLPSDQELLALLRRALA